MFKQNTYYVLQDVDGNLIGIDSTSGGYPYVTHFPGSVAYFTTYEDADKYRKTGSEHFEIKEITFNIK